MLAKSGEKLKLENGRLKDYELTIHYFLSYSNVLISLRFFFFFLAQFAGAVAFPRTSDQFAPKPAPPPCSTEHSREHILDSISLSSHPYSQTLQK